MKKQVLLGGLVTGVAALLVLIYVSFFCSKTITNVVLISIDTCRADRLSCYGFKRKTTPNIDMIAKEGVLFENAISPAVLTLPAHSSMLTGMIPPVHGVHDNMSYMLDKSTVTLTELLKSNGFNTAAFISAFVLDSQFGLDQGFDTYNDDFGSHKLTRSISERRGDETSRVAIEWLNKHKDEKFFMFLHYFDPHQKYNAPEPFGSRFMLDPYAGEIAYTDHCIGQVIEKLKDLDLYDSTLIVITSDHGESLGEHGEQTHGYFIYQSTIKVPLIFRFPGGPRGVRVRPNVSLVDIAPTICKLLGISIPFEIQGTDLSAYFSNGNVEKTRSLYSGSLMPTEYGCNSLTGIVKGDYKYIQTNRPELYNLKDDPAEIKNLAGEQPQRVRVMQADLKQIMAMRLRTEKGSTKISYLDSQSRAKLESLGYVTTVKIDDSFEFDRSKADPKDMIDFHILDSTVATFLDMNMYDEVKKICSRMMELNSDYPMTYYYLGTALFKEADYEAAVKYLSGFIELDADNYQVYNNLGMSLISLGRFGEAQGKFIKAIEIYPDYDMAHYNLGRVLHQQGNYAEAIDHFRKARQLSPNERSIQFGLNKAMKYRKIADIITQDMTDDKILDTLDAIVGGYAEARKIFGAVEILEGAIKIAGSSGRKKLVRKLRDRLKNYKNVIQKP